MATNKAVCLVHTHYNKAAMYLSEAKRTSVAQVLPLTKLPSRCQVLGLAAFNRPIRNGGEKGTPIIGVIFMVKKASEEIFMLNVYGLSASPNASLSIVFSSCKQKQLGFTPFELTHTTLLSPNGEVDLLLAGSDCCLHVYRLMGDSFTELVGRKHPLPHLTKTTSSIVSLDIQSDATGEAVAVAGFQDGLISLACLTPNPNGGGLKVHSTHQYYTDGAASTVSLLVNKPVISSVAIGRGVDTLAAITTELNGMHKRAWSECEMVQAPMGLLVGSALGYAVAYGDIQQSNFSKETFLPQSDRDDSVLCSGFMDVNMDGHDEILLGTYNQHLLVYKTNVNEDGKLAGTGYELSSDPDLDERSGPFQLSTRVAFDHPIYALDAVDLNRDGIDELVVTTMYSIQVFEVDMECCAGQLRATVDLVKEVQQLEEQLRSLQTQDPDGHLAISCT